MDERLLSEMEDSDNKRYTDSREAEAVVNACKGFGKTAKKLAGSSNRKPWDSALATHASELKKLLVALSPTLGTVRIVPCT